MIPCPQIDIAPSGTLITITPDLGPKFTLHLPPQSARLMAQRLVLLADRIEAQMFEPRRMSWIGDDTVSVSAKDYLDSIGYAEDADGRPVAAPKPVAKPAKPRARREATLLPGD